ncbi:MAG: SMC family ATPase, partial [Candidatus Tectomicrobia bacterium]|nr:SMC family ATPase [Candidatus Tectomicrobia bacterium]
RGAELDAKRQGWESFLQDEPAIVQAYEQLRTARRGDAEMARTMQLRHVREQEKARVELSIQQKRHDLQLQQRSVLDRHNENRQKEAALPGQQEKAERLHRQLAVVDQQGQQLEETRATEATLTFQLTQALPLQHKALRTEIQEYEGKRRLLGGVEAHCPLCETPLTEGDRQRVMQTLRLEIEQREQRIRDLQDERSQLHARRQELRRTTEQLGKQVEHGKGLTRQLAAVQADIEEAKRARDQRVNDLDLLQDIDARLASGAYAREDLDHLERLNGELERFAYDPDAHEALRKKLDQLAEAETRHLQLEQVKAELRASNDLRRELAGQQVELREALASSQFATTEQREHRKVSERLLRLDYQPERHRLLRGKMQELQDVDRRFAQLETARQRLTESRTALQGLEARQSRTATEIKSLEGDRERIELEVRLIDPVRAEAASAEAVVANLREREGETRLALGRSQSQYEVCLQRDAELKAQRERRQHVVYERQLYDDLTHMFGRNGIQAIIIENAIPELADEANRILSRVSDNAMHVTLETQRDTRSGGVAETLDIKISDDLGTRNYELYSGGEAFRINFALRIALSRMLARRAGARLRTLVIDEGFGTQDTQGLERLVEVIKAIQDDFAKIIVITHLPELKNAFETHIEVTKDPILGSSFEVV